MKEIQVRSGARFLLEFCCEKKKFLWPALVHHFQLLSCVWLLKIIMLQLLQGMWLPTVGLCG